MIAKQTARELLSKAGITINGNKPYDIIVHNEKLYRRVLSEGLLGLGESYMDGWWDVEQLDEFFSRVIKADLSKYVTINIHTVGLIAKSTIINMANKKRSKAVAEEHYDLSNEFYEDMLDPLMQYTCAYWKDAKTLAKAQENKLDLICRKLKLKKGDKVLELGCGWGGFARFAAKNYGVSVTAYNISKEQIAYAKKKSKGLPVKYVLSDYRDAKGVYDKVVSIGMCEHVGFKNYNSFMQLVSSLMRDDSLFLLHTIGSNRSVVSTNPWTHKYIFPNSMLPSIAQLGKAFEGLFVMEDWHNIGPDYDKTLMAWYNNFISNYHKWEGKFGERFKRMWSYYLLQSAGGFRARYMQLWQVVLSKPGKISSYEPER